MTAAVGAVWTALGIYQKYIKRSRLRDPEVFALPVTPAGTSIYRDEVPGLRQYLVGRDDDIETYTRQIRDHAVVHVTGPSGVGKSTLLKLGVARNLYRDGYLPVYVDTWGEDWIAGPFNALADALHRAVEAGLIVDLRHLLATGGVVTRDNVLPALRELRNTAGRHPVLIFDQIDSYLSQNWDNFTSQGVFLSPEELTSRNPFWRQICDLCLDRIAHVVFSVRSDAAAVLGAFHFEQPTIISVRPLLRTDVQSLVRTLVHDRAIDRPENGFDQLIERIASELNQRGVDQGVLPIQLRVVLSGLSELKYLTPGALRQAGGIRGLEAAHIWKHIRKAPGDDEQVVSVLLGLVDSKLNGSEYTHARSAQELATETNLPSRLVEDSLKSLEEVRIVRKSVGSSEQDRWQLYHDYLALGVLSLDRVFRDFSILLQERSEAYADADTAIDKFSSLLTTKEQLTLFLNRLRGRFSYGAHRRFAILSLARLILNPATCIAVIAALLITQQIAQERMASYIVASFDVGRETQDVEATALRSLQLAVPDVKRRVLTLFLTNSGTAKRFFNHRNRILSSIIGFNRETADAVAWPVLAESCAGEVINDQGILMACGLTASYLGAGEKAGLFFERAMEGTTDAVDINHLTFALIDGGEGVYRGRVVAFMHRIRELLVEEFEHQRSIILLQEAGNLIRVASPAERSAMSRDLSYAARKTRDPYLLSGLAKLLPLTSEGLDRSITYSVSHNIGEMIQAERNPSAQASLVSGLIALGDSAARSDLEAAAVSALDAVGRAEGTRRQGALAEPVALLSDWVGSEYATKAGEMLVRAMEATADPVTVGALGKGLASLGKHIDRSLLIQGLRRTEAVGATTTEDSGVLGIRKGQEALEDALDESDPIRVVRRLLQRIRESEFDRGGNDLGRRLGAATERLSPKDWSPMAQEIMDQLTRADDLGQIDHLGRGLKVLSTKVEESQRAVVAREVGSTIDRISQTAIMFSFSTILTDITGPEDELRLRADARIRAVMTWISDAAIADDRTTQYRIRDLVRALGTLHRGREPNEELFVKVAERLKGLPSPPCKSLGELGSARQMIDLLKTPVCAADRDDIILGVVKRQGGDPSECGEFRDEQYRADLWRFVDWAGKQRLSSGEMFDLVSPPPAFLQRE